MGLTVILIIAFFSIVILINILIARLIIKKAINKFAIPKLESNGMTLIDYKLLAPFDTGNFKNTSIKIKPANSNGNTLMSFYADIIYTSSGFQKKVTMKVDTFTFIIKNVAYSSDFI